MICFAALMVAAKPGTQLQPVMLAFGDLLVTKVSSRGLQMNRDQLAEAALADVEEMVLPHFHVGATLAR